MVFSRSRRFRLRLVTRLKTLKLKVLRFGKNMNKTRERRLSRTCRVDDEIDLF
uniref:Uncharacterized protein n=1 Tax=Nelumbo nucifera TaxID=4432 RepID=A0A822XQ26_NELNU|nr:TPA_asm: hypothetical protein HUJ06_022499 [Nelumbo nucifera]